MDKITMQRGDPKDEDIANVLPEDVEAFKAMGYKVVKAEKPADADKKD